MTQRKSERFFLLLFNVGQNSAAVRKRVKQRDCKGEKKQTAAAAGERRKDSCFGGDDDRDYR